MSLQSTLRTRMSLWPTWRRATWVSLLRRPCWPLSYLTGSSRSAFWVSHSIWRSCFSGTTPANDLAWGCTETWPFLPNMGLSSLWAIFALGLTSGLPKAFQDSIFIWCFSYSSSFRPSFLPQVSDLQHSTARSHSLSTPVPVLLYLSQTLLPINVCTLSWHLRSRRLN